MRKQTKRKSLKTQPSNTQVVNENVAPKNEAPASFVQSKASLDYNGPDLTGTWNTCGQDVMLSQKPDTEIFEGSWGVHTLRFQLEGDEIRKAHLGSMELMFVGTLAGPGRIEWGNGQVWTRG